MSAELYNRVPCNLVFKPVNIRLLSHVPNYVDGLIRRGVFNVVHNEKNFIGKCCLKDTYFPGTHLLFVENSGCEVG